MTSHPNPMSHSDLYRDVPSKRLFAWIMDVFLITLLTLFLSLFTLFTALFIFPLFFAVISFLYRWTSLTLFSGTPGMSLMALSILDRDGESLNIRTAFLHTAGYFVSVAVFPLQLVSIALILMSEKHQSLTDMVLGTAAINRRA